MSITTALSNALSGLTAASRGAEVVSGNIAHAQTPGYARRELLLGASLLGGAGNGVRILGVARWSDAVVLGDLRLADGAFAGQDTRLQFRLGFEATLGAAEPGGGLSGRIAALEAALAEAANRPDSEARLGGVLAAAQDLAGHLNDTADAVQAARMQADAGIGEAVARLNADLAAVRDLNAQIRALGTMGRDASGLIDERQRAIDRIAAQVPLRELPRERGTVALVSTGGAILVDGSAAEFGFTRTPTITADMTLASGALSGLTLNGKPLATGGEGGRIAGGRLAALFDIRDRLAAEAQARLDSAARDLYDRFADAAVDPSLAPGAPGLFTDAGAAFDPLDEVGLAGRLAVNAAADPAEGGALWRLRGGLGAAAPGAPGDSTLLRAMGDALAVARAPASGPFAGQARSAGALAGELAALWTGETLQVETRTSQAAARADALRQHHLAGGVDTDDELQKLMLLEQAYAANAQVIRTIDEMMTMLFGL